MSAKAITAGVRKYLLPNLKGFGQRGRLIFRDPPGELLAGCLFDVSSFDNARFVVHAFVQPLYVPDTTYNLTFGHRLGGGAGRWWILPERQQENMMAEIREVIEQEALSIFDRFVTPEDFARHATDLASNATGERLFEAVAYSWILAGRYDLAAEELRSMQLDLTTTVPWMKEMKDRAQLLLATLKDNPRAAQELLDRWRVETLRQVKLYSTKK